MDSGVALKSEGFSVSWGTEGRLVFRFLKWDSEFFNVPAYLLDTEYSNPAGMAAYYEEIRKKVDNALPQGFITAKIPHDWDTSAASLFQDCGFKYILTELVLKYSRPGKMFPAGNDVTIESVIPGEDVDLSHLGKYLNLSRFHQDRRIEKGLADRLWNNFLENFKVSENENVVIIARKNRGVVGCIVIMFQHVLNKRYANFFIVSVDEAYQGMGIGTRLMEYGIGLCGERSEGMIVETQSNNIPALNFYLKNGFTEIHNTRVIFHRWAS